MEYDPNLPMVCMDEKSKQLLKDGRNPIKGRPGSVGKYDYEYKRKGLAIYLLQWRQRSANISPR